MSLRSILLREVPFTMHKAVRFYWEGHGAC